ncbi:hypothetical protein [Methanobrevibacter sp. DSM 116169]|uniref:hypothetical protein n=1 Tax=Methanobrevibacter sp. DSM 116169 TaxID=3242727 RepID=UPI0038FD1B08
MEKSKLAILIVIIVVVIVGIAGVLLLNNGSSDDNNTNTTNKNDSNKNISDNSTSKNKTVVTHDVSAVQEGPSAAKEGSTVTVKWTVTNKGSLSITNVKGISQYGDYNFGTIEPGQSKTTSFELSTQGPYDENESEKQESLFIGGFGLEYDFNGKHFKTNSNTIEIALN